MHRIRTTKLGGEQLERQWRFSRTDQFEKPAPNTNAFLVLEFFHQLFNEFASARLQPKESVILQQLISPLSHHRHTFLEARELFLFHFNSLRYSPMTFTSTRFGRRPSNSP